MRGSCRLACKACHVQRTFASPPLRGEERGRFLAALIYKRVGKQQQIAACRLSLPRGYGSSRNQWRLRVGSASTKWFMVHTNSLLHLHSENFPRRPGLALGLGLKVKHIAPKLSEMSQRLYSRPQKACRQFTRGRPLWHRSCSEDAGRKEARNAIVSPHVAT